MRPLSLSCRGYRSFAELDFPFVAVATDLVAGSPIVISEGRSDPERAKAR